MKGRFRVFKAGQLHHIYQRTINGFVIFYSISDFLVFFTQFCTLARKHKVQVLGLCLMYDHIHALIVASSRQEMSSFVQEYTCRFSRRRNEQYNRKGPFFQCRFGSAPKSGAKKARTAIAYLYNNPVEKQLCNKAEEFQWCFLKYANCDHPFSEPLKLYEASRKMRRAISVIMSRRAMEMPLSYESLTKISDNLTNDELKQLTDFVVTKYNCIDYSALEQFYGDFSSLLTAIHSNTGSEYQIKEVVDNKSDKVYRRMQAVIKKMTGYKHIKEVLSLPDDEKRHIAWILSAETNATIAQISKFLHIKLDQH